MLIEPLHAARFITAYKSVLLEINRSSRGHTHDDIVKTLASARSYLKQHPDSLDAALGTVEAAGTPVAADVVLALRSMRIEQWVYLRSTTRYAIFLDATGSCAFAVLGLTNPIKSIVGRNAVTFESGVFPFCGRYVCDGIIQAPVHLGPGYTASFNASLAALKRQGQFVKPPGSTQS